MGLCENSHFTGRQWGPVSASLCDSDPRAAPPSHRLGQLLTAHTGASQPSQRHAILWPRASWHLAVAFFLVGSLNQAKENFTATFSIIWGGCRQCACEEASTWDPLCFVIYSGSVGATWCMTPCLNLSSTGPTLSLPSDSQSSRTHTPHWVPVSMKTNVFPCEWAML